jgi:hypothetical protein
LALVAIQAPADAAAVHRCHTSRLAVYDVSARNMTCRRALRLIGRVHYVGNGSFTARLRGWRCRTLAKLQEGATFRCARGSRAFRWTASG